MPVGQAVTATRLTLAAVAAGAGCGAAAAGAARGGRRPRRAGAGSTTRADQRDHLVGLAARAQRGGEVGLHQGAGQLGQQLEVGGVAAGGGGDQEGEVGRAVLGAEVDRRGRAGRRPGSARRRPAVRQCGMAIPPGRPVAEVSSRASASVDELVGVGRRGPASSTTPARARMTSCLSVPRSASSRTRSAVISRSCGSMRWGRRVELADQDQLGMRSATGWGSWCRAVLRRRCRRRRPARAVRGPCPRRSPSR